MRTYFFDVIIDRDLVSEKDSDRVTHVEPLDNYALKVTFATEEVKRVDCRPFLDKGIFRLLKDETAFRCVRPINNGGGIGWESGADLSRDNLYARGVPL